MSVIFTPRAAAHQPRRRRNRPAVVLPRARRLPGRRGDRQVRLHAHPHRLPAALPAEVLGVRGGRRPAEIQHPILREALLRHWSGDPLEIASVADVPAGTGLGSSGAFTVCLLKALALARRMAITPGALAEDACEIEIDILGEPVGKQDQYVAAHGGICAYTFNPDGTVDVEPLELVARDARRELREQPPALLHRRGARARPTILADQDERTESGRRRRCSRTSHRTKEIGLESRALLEAGDLEQLRRADARALGEQAQPLAGHGDRADRRPLHAGAPQRRHRRQARRRRRRRLPARLRATAGRHASGDGSGAARRSSGSTSSSRAASARVHVTERAGEQRRSASASSAAALIGPQARGRARPRRARRLLRRGSAGGERSCATVRRARMRARVDELLATGARRRRRRRDARRARRHRVPRAAMRARTCSSRSRPGSAWQTSSRIAETARGCRAAASRSASTTASIPAIARAVAEARSGGSAPIMHMRGPLRARRAARLRARVARRPRAVRRRRAGGSGHAPARPELLRCSGRCRCTARCCAPRSGPWTVEDNAVVILGERDVAARGRCSTRAGRSGRTSSRSRSTARPAKLQVDGLAGSYGPQRLGIYAMRPELGPPDVEELDVPLGRHVVGARMGGVHRSHRGRGRPAVAGRPPVGAIRLELHRGRLCPRRAWSSPCLSEPCCRS